MGVLQSGWYCLDWCPIRRGLGQYHHHDVQSGGPLALGWRLLLDGRGYFRSKAISVLPSQSDTARLADSVTKAKLVDKAQSQARDRAIFAAVSGAHLMARSRPDLLLFDQIIADYQGAGLLRLAPTALLLRHLGQSRRPCGDNSNGQIVFFTPRYRLSHCTLTVWRTIVDKSL